MFLKSIVKTQVVGLIWDYKKRILLGRESILILTKIDIVSTLFNAAIKLPGLDF